MRLLLALVAVLAFAAPATAAVPRVVATIKPVHALVAAVMGALGTPDLVVKGAASPHTYSLRPSDAAALEAADVVFWVGPGLELFLQDSLATLAPHATTVALSDDPAIALLPVREGGAFEPHEDDDEAGHEHALGEADMHFWLDPANAAVMLARIADTLAAADPGHAETYRTNADSAAGRLATLTASLAAELAPVRDRPFIVFHDAYQYFEHRFGLTVAGSVTVTPETLPGAQRIGELRDAISAAGAVCVFAEPQFEPAVVGTIIEGTAARSGMLDPEGASLEPGPQLYGALLQGLADGLVDCLSGP